VIGLGSRRGSRPEPSPHGNRSWRGATSFFLAVLLSGCGPAGEKEGAEGSASGEGGGGESLGSVSIPEGGRVVAGITPGIKGGKLVLAIAGDPKTFNPVTEDDLETRRIIRFMFDPLFDFDHVDQVETPSLAESWAYRAESREWVFRLRPGLRWSDGAPLTADDFVFFAECVFDGNVPTHLREFFQTGGEPYVFSAPDPLTFVARIPTVDSFAFQNLGELRALPRHCYESFLKDGSFAHRLGTDTPPADVIVSGPFRLKAFISGQRVVLEANPHYRAFDAPGTRLPYLDELVVLNVPDFDAMALRFQAGDLDLIETIQPQNLVVLQDDQARGDYTVFNPGLRIASTYLWFNLKPGGTYLDPAGRRVAWTPPGPGAEPPPEIAARSYRPYVDPVKLRWFDRVAFRRACSMAANREAMVQTILFGQGAPLYSPEGPSNLRWHNPDIPTYPYNLEQAARELAGIGLVDRDGDGLREDEQGRPVRFTIITNKENRIREKIGVLLKEDLAKLGFDVRLQLLDFNDIVTRTADTYDYEACLLGIGGAVPPHPAQAANVFLSAGRLHSWNPSQKTPATAWEARIDDLYESMKRVFTYEEQKAIYDEILTIYAENQPTIELVAQQVFVAARNRIGNLKPSVLEPHLTHNIEQLYWKRR